MPKKPRELNEHCPIHITARSNNREHFPLPMIQVWPILTDYLALAPIAFDIRLISFVLMPNHFHLIVRDPNLQISKFMSYFMRETSREIGRLSKRINRIWGGAFHSSVIRDNIYFFHAYKYVYRNPVKAHLCRSVLDYPYSTLSHLLGYSKAYIPLEEDTILFPDIESTLFWLNESYNEADSDALRCALKRKQFKLRLDKKSKAPSQLGNWSLLPYSLRKEGILLARE